MMPRPPTLVANALAPLWRQRCRHTATWTCRQTRAFTLDTSEAEPAAVQRQPKPGLSTTTEASANSVQSPGSEKQLQFSIRTYPIGIEGLREPPEIERVEELRCDDESISFRLKVRFGNSSHLWKKLSKLYLRDVCQCSTCVSPSSGQKTFATCDIAPVPQLLASGSDSIRLTEDGSVEITWENDFTTGGKHTSVYPLDLLRRLVAKTGNLHHFAPPSRQFWDTARYENERGSSSVSYADWMAGGADFARAMLDLMQYGLVFLRGVPREHDAVKNIASKIGDLQSTFYGPTWDVVSKPDAENVAYTNEFLGLHQDLLYWADYPKVQLLHCLDNECQGGESLFSDGLRAAWHLKLQDPHNYRPLINFPVTYHYERAGHYYLRYRRVIEKGLNGDPVAIAWSPPFQGPFRLQSRQAPMEEDPEATALADWAKAARAFKTYAESPENMMQYRMQPGDCAIFDNMRILHGRTRFDTSSGKRHLRGAYLDAQTLKSAFVRLREQGLLGEVSAPGGKQTAEARQAFRMFR